MADKSKAMEFHGQAALLESRTANERFEVSKEMSYLLSLFKRILTVSVFNEMNK